MVSAALALGGTGVVSADPGGTPNQSACLGEAISLLAKQGVTPVTLAQRSPNTTAADVNRAIAQLCASGEPASQITASDVTKYIDKAAP